MVQVVFQTAKTILWEMLHLDGADPIGNRLVELKSELREVRSFHLVVAEPSRDGRPAVSVRFRWDGDTLDRDDHEGPYLYVSSSLGQTGAEEARASSWARLRERHATIDAGVLFLPVPVLRTAVSLSWAGWSRASDDLARYGGGTAFDTFGVGGGLELGGIGLGLPLRLGARYATLPFSPNDEQPREIDLSMGTGIGLAGGLALLDVAVERVMRDGAGVSEQAWHVSLGVRVRP